MMAKTVSSRDLAIISQLRSDGRMTLTQISRKTNIPVSSVFEKLKAFRASELIQPTVLTDFSRLGMGTRALIAIKVDRDARADVEEFLKHPRVNNLLRVSNGYTFMIDIIMDMRGIEDFLEDLETRFRIRKKMVFYVISEVRREAFLCDPETAEAIVTGKRGAQS